jgi:hypothetical protein
MELVANKVDKKWGASTLGKRVHVGTKRAGLTNLDRFKLCKAKAAATGWSLSHSVPRRGSWKRLASCYKIIIGSDSYSWSAPEYV